MQLRCEQRPGLDSQKNRPIAARAHAVLERNDFLLLFWLRFDLSGSGSAPHWQMLKENRIGFLKEKFLASVRVCLYIK